jgi:hypothetical protein
VWRGHAPAAGWAAGERLATGSPELDRLLDGGLPRGRLSELTAGVSAGATTLAQHVVAGATAAGFAAWVDPGDAFDPASASAAGVKLARLLWIRPPDPAAAFATTEIVLHAGGFSVVLLDLLSLAADRGVGPRRDIHLRRGSQPARNPTQNQTHVWLRLVRAAEQSGSALVVLSRQGSPAAGSFSALRLQLAPARVLWDGSAGTPYLLDGLITRLSVLRNRFGSRHGELALRFALD